MKNYNHHVKQRKKKVLIYLTTQKSSEMGVKKQKSRGFEEKKRNIHETAI